jgi:hypothetical protein
MKITCSFYIGHQDYLGDKPRLKESESKEKLCAKVSTIVYRNIGREQFEIYQAKDVKELKAVIRINDEVINAYGFSTETAVADDEEGLPVLFYVNAHFETPDDEDFNGDSDATLYAGDLSLTFEGIAEAEEEE